MLLPVQYYLLVSGAFISSHEQSRGLEQRVFAAYLCNVPLHPIRDHPPLPQWTPVPVAHAMLLLIEHRRIARPVVHPSLARNNHISFEPAQHSATHNRRPRIHGLHDLDARSAAGSTQRMCRPLTVWRRRSARKARFEAAVQVVRLAKAADEDDARDGAAFGAQSVDLTLYEVADFLDDGIEDVLDLGGCHDHKTAVDSDFFVVCETWESVHELLSLAFKRKALKQRSQQTMRGGGYIRNIDLLMLVLVKVTLDKFLKVLQAHLPRLILFDLHFVKPALTEPLLDVFFESVVEERTAAQPSCPYSRLFHFERFEGYDLVGD